MVAVCALPVGAGAVKVAEVVVSLDIVPGPLTVQVTPPVFLSLVTVAVNVVVSFPSTVLDAAVTATLVAGALPPHPNMASSKYCGEHTQDDKPPELALKHGSSLVHLADAATVIVGLVGMDFCDRLDAKRPQR